MPEAATIDDKLKPEDEVIDIVELKEGEEAPDPNASPADGEEGGEGDGQTPAQAAAEGDDDDDPDRQRREHRKLTRERSKAARERDRLAARELEIMRTQNAEMANRLAQLEGQQRSQSQYIVSNRLEQAQTYKRQADIAFAEAVAKGDAAATLQAQQHQQAAEQAIRQLSHVGEQIKAMPAPQPVRAPVDPRATRRAQSWANEHAWFDPNGRDPDSRMALAIDSKLIEEGYDNTSDEHYAELDRRLAAAIPNRYAGQTQRNGANGNGTQHNDNNRRRDMPSSSSSEGAGAPNKNQFYLTPGRKRQMQQAGIDPADIRSSDPKKRAAVIDMVNRYREYDRQNPPTRR